MAPITFDFEGSASGECVVAYPVRDGIPSIRLGEPLPQTSPDATRRRLLDTVLKLAIPKAATDVSKAGHSWLPRTLHPTLWDAPSEPVTTVEPLLPNGYAGMDAPLTVAFRETREADAGGSDPASSTALALARRRKHAQQGTREHVRGRTGSMPFMPGGEQWNVAGNPAAAAAAEEASTGAWLHELESGHMPRVTAPGMPRGAFGAFQTASHPDIEESNIGDEGANGADALASDMQALDVGGDGHPAGAAERTAAALEDLFQGVWLLEEDEEVAAPTVGALAGLDEEELASTAKEEPAGAAAESALDVLAALPSDVDLPGGVATLGVDDLLGVLQAPSSADAAWGPGRPAPTTAPAATAGLVPKGAARTNWAVRAAIKDLDKQWARLQQGLAKRYSFELDVFQKEAIIHMEAGRSVFVAAHTSAGKTVAAEYALALAMKHCTRAVYTSPIKTISNQKFRDFSGQFEVGLLTGDVSIKPDSSCLIMTTEILRSMLYKGADIIRDIEWVIFDEVHYVNDAERGVVWEEVIIMLPEHVNLVLLSATVPNVLEFADWVGRTKRKVVHVTGTTRRPVPLEHSMYYGGQFYTICTAEKYDPTGYKRAKDAQNKKTAAPQTKAEAKAALPTGRGDGGGRGGRGGGPGRGPARSHRPSGAPGGVGSGGGGASGAPQLRSEKSQWNQLIADLKKKDLLPMVAFCFSKKRCDALADTLRSLDMTTAAEKSEIHIFCDRALARLKGSDRELPQVLRLREMLKRGVGVHHAGLLPIVKEIVEMLFCRGVIKVLFSTETFAMGVNAPARTVVFQSLRKHDGRQFRTLFPGEYTQMAGRAGRRGLDAVGTVIIACWDALPEETDIRRLLTGAATKLESQFRLTYSMILNLLRVEDLKVEDMLKRSFAEFHAQRAQPEVQEALHRGQQALRRLRARPWPQSPLGTTRDAVEEYAEIAAAAETLGDRVQEAVMGTRGATSALVNGRVVLVLRRATGVTELGVILDAAEASGGGGGKKKVLNAPFPAPTGASMAGEGRRRTVLLLHRPSPLDSGEPAAPAAADGHTGTADATPGGFGGSAGASGGPGGMRMMSKKDDDDLESMFGGMKARGGGGGGKGRGGGARSPIALPHADAIGGVSYLLTEVPATDIVGICKSKVRVDVEDVLTGDKACTAAAVNALVQVQDSAGDDLPLMDPISDLKVNSLELAADIRERQQLLARLATLPPHRDPMLPEMLAAVRSERLLVSRLAAIARQSGDAGLAQLPEFHQRVKVLQILGYLDADRTVTMKGRVACEVNSGDELVATELIFGGVLTDLSPEEAVALLSALVFQEKTEAEPELPPRLLQAREEAVALALSAGVTQREAGLDVLPEDFVRSTLKFGLMEVVYQWAQGTPFSEICGLTDVMEGSIVRTIVRLDETCREFRDAARVMGNTVLFQQMEAASNAIKRDIVFSASLYLA